MAGNTKPIFPGTPKISWGNISAANTAKDGTGTVVTIFTAGANGARIDQIKVRALGTNVATVMRFFVNNGLDNTSADNNSLAHEATIAATTASEVAALADNDIVITKGDEVVVPIPYLPPGYQINITIGTAVAAGLQVTCFGGDY